MAKVSAVLWTYRLNAAGQGLLRLRFADTRRTVYLSMGVHLHPRHWNARAGAARKGYEHAEAVNALVARRLSEAEGARLRLLLEGVEPTAERLRDALAPTKDAALDGCFLADAEAFLEGVERAGNPQRVDKERAVLAKLRAFLAGVPPPGRRRGLAARAREAAEAKAAAVRLPTAALTPDLLRRFEAHLLGPISTGGLGNKASTVQAAMGVLRLHVRRGIREGRIPQAADPFAVYSSPRAAASARARLTLDQIARLDALDLGARGPQGSLAARVRDAFLLAIYAGGLRFGDVVRLRRGNVSGEPGARRLALTAGKTGKVHRVRLVPAAERIVGPYLVRADGTPKAAGDFLLRGLGDADGRPAYDLSTPRGLDRAVASQTALANKTLARLAARAGVEGGLSTHAARHSFASVAAAAGWGVQAVQAALGHSSLDVTARYLGSLSDDARDAALLGLFADPTSSPSDDA